MKNEMMETNQTGFLALQDFDLADVMCAEMDGLSAAFERVKIPSGGGVMFEIPGENPEEPDTVKTFSAVILYQHSLNAYYQSEYQGGSNPPDCGSFDGHHGEGTPGGDCGTCPLNQYGSGKERCKSLQEPPSSVSASGGRYFSGNSVSAYRFSEVLYSLSDACDPQIQEFQCCGNKIYTEKSSQRHWHELFPGTVCRRTGIVSGRISADRSCDRTGQGS